MPDVQDHWYLPIRALHDEAFQEEWAERLERFNQQPAVNKSGVPFYLPHPRLPPAWFNGDIECLNRNQWVLVISLNPHIDPQNKSLSNQQFDQDGWWNYWRHFNLGGNWKGQFFPRLVTLAASCMGIDVSQSETHRFATDRMLFVEFYPYASGGFPKLSWKSWKAIAATEPGFMIARIIRQWLFDYGQPSLVLCNGQLATYDVKDQQFGTDRMHQYWIARQEDTTASMSIYDGTYSPKVGSPFRVVGFNQLGRQAGRPTHEVELIRRFVREEQVLIRQL